MMQVQQMLKMEQLLKVLIPPVLNRKMLLHGTEGLSLMVQNAAADIAGNLKGDGAGVGVGTAAVVACPNDKEGMVDNVVRNQMAADKIAVDIVQVVVGA